MEGQPDMYHPPTELDLTTLTSPLLLILFFFKTRLGWVFPKTATAVRAGSFDCKHFFFSEGFFLERWPSDYSDFTVIPKGRRFNSCCSYKSSHSIHSGARH